MSSKAKSGLSAVRAFWEDIVIPPNTFTVGDTSFTTKGRDGKGHAAVHAAVTNDTPGTLNIYQAWQRLGPYVLTDAIITGVDPGGTGLQIADATIPIIRRYVKVQFLPSTTIGANFELGAYFTPRGDSPEISSAGSGGGGASAVANRGAFATDQLNVALAGTAQSLPAQAVPNGFATVITAKKTNTKNIYLGNSKVNAQNHALADILAPGDNRKLFLTNWSLEWIDADVGGEGVTILSET